MGTVYFSALGVVKLYWLHCIWYRHTIKNIILKKIFFFNDTRYIIFFLERYTCKKMAVSTRSTNQGGSSRATFVVDIMSNIFRTFLLAA